MQNRRQVGVGPRYCASPNRSARFMCMQRDVQLECGRRPAPRRRRTDCARSSGSDRFEQADPRWRASAGMAPAVPAVRSPVWKMPSFHSGTRRGLLRARRTAARTDRVQGGEGVDDRRRLACWRSRPVRRAGVRHDRGREAGEVAAEVCGRTPSLALLHPPADAEWSSRARSADDVLGRHHLAGHAHCWVPCRLLGSRALPINEGITNCETPGRGPAHREALREPEALFT